MVIENQAENEQIIQAVILYVKGLVQGVGFRPFVYRSAINHNLKGWVENRNDCVRIKVEGSRTNIDFFIHTLKNDLPEAAYIDSISSELSESENSHDFRIVPSKNISGDITLISPDISVCKDCLEDMENQPHRVNYPFINCTNCGPRFTIIKDLPYDRENTTMRKFVMCSECKKEYTDVSDRRFHAQPVACNNCGPSYKLHLPGEIINNFDDILSKISGLISNGKIIALKGIGGFHLACDSTNNKAVERMRNLKIREGKPFAVMFRNIEKLKEFAYVNKEEEKLLLSWRRPIVILKNKVNSLISPGVFMGLDTLGVMLPYMPLHYLLFEKITTPSIVLTSGNLSDEPIVIDNEIALQKFFTITDAVLVYNRDIYNRTDDSVAVVINNREIILRRSRAYAPSPVNLMINVDGIIATGAELQNCFCVGKGHQAFLSQHIGDLKNIETFNFYNETFEKFIKLFRVSPSLAAMDMHPEYLSTRYGDKLPLDKIFIQHHHAHIASCMAEYGLDEKVIGISFDGTGYGDDGNIWGSEFFICDLNEYQRFTHFEYIPLPGGDKVTKEPWRAGVSYLYKVFGKDFREMDFNFLRNIPAPDIDILLTAIDRSINSPLSSGAGRFFDAVAAILGLCNFSSYHAEPPMKLESIIEAGCNERYNFEINNDISFRQTIVEIVEDMKTKSQGLISAKFHNTIVAVIPEVSKIIRNKYGLNNVVLSGGTFQNRYILNKVEKQLLDLGFQVYIQTRIPCNDGGIALGQLIIAGKRRELGLIDKNNL